MCVGINNFIGLLGFLMNLVFSLSLRSSIKVRGSSRLYRLYFYSKFRCLVSSTTAVLKMSYGDSRQTSPVPNRYKFVCYQLIKESRRCLKERRSFSHIHFRLCVMSPFYTLGGFVSF